MKKEPQKKEPQKPCPGPIRSVVDTWPQLRRHIGLAALAVQGMPTDRKPEGAVVSNILQPLVDGLFNIYGRQLAPTDNKTAARKDAGRS